MQEISTKYYVLVWLAQARAAHPPYFTIHPFSSCLVAVELVVAWTWTRHAPGHQQRNPWCTTTTTTHVMEESD